MKTSTFMVSMFLVAMPLTGMLMNQYGSFHERGSQPFVQANANMNGTTPFQESIDDKTIYCVSTIMDQVAKLDFIPKADILEWNLHQCLLLQGAVI